MKRILMFLFSAAVFAGSAFGTEPSYETFIAHRGESKDAPENSMPAFKLAVERGFGFECDLYLSKDKRVFSFHDKTLTRTGGVKLKTTEVSWEETLSKLDVGSFKGKQWAGTRPALLEEILLLARKNRKIYLEIKDDVKIIPYIKKILEGQSNANPDTALFICFNEQVCAALKKAMPEYKVYWLCGTHVRKKGAKGKHVPIRGAADVIEVLKEIKADGVDICWNRKIVTEEFVKELGAAGFEVHVWTVDKWEEAKEALRRGVRTVTTNCAKKLLDESRKPPAVYTTPLGGEIVCEDGVCKFVEPAASESEEKTAAPSVAASRIAHGLMSVDAFVAFLENRAVPVSALAGKAWWLVLILVLFGGLCLNLTPCVLPMVPINLMIIGRSASRGALYGAGIALAYGALGVLAAVGGRAFGELQGSPWFNASIAVLFVVLALALFEVFFIDFSRRRGELAAKRQNMWPSLFAFFMGMVSAILAGACVAPILIAVLLLTVDLFAKGNYFALALPFVLGLGMALPWPFAGAGLKVLPKPGAWMTKVNRLFGILVLGFAAWYGYLAWRGFSQTEPAEPVESGTVKFDSPGAFTLEGLKKPVLVDCWASWCKNCTAMERTTLADPRVKQALEKGGITFVKLQAEDIAALKRLPGFEKVIGLPAFVLFE